MVNLLSQVVTGVGRVRQLVALSSGVNVEPVQGEAVVLVKTAGLQ
jgi:hypothetical protein